MLDPAVKALRDAAALPMIRRSRNFFAPARRFAAHRRLFRERPRLGEPGKSEIDVNLRAVRNLSR